MELFPHILIVVLVAQISYSQPVDLEPAYSHTGPDFMEAVVQYTKSQAESTSAMIRNVLLHLPKTEAYEEHRDLLRKLLQHAEDFKRPGPCHTKIHTFSRCMGDVVVSYLMSDDSVEHKEVLSLMEEYGMKEMMIEANAFLGKVTRGEFGTPVEAGSQAFTAFLAKEC